MKYRKTFFVTDLHGNYKGLKQALERADFNMDEDLLITGGDYIDGGNHIEIEPIVDYLMSLPNWIGVIGNHDYWMKEHIELGVEEVKPIWFKQGGKQTLDSIGVEYYTDNYIAKLASPIPSKYKEFLDKLVYYYHDEERNYMFIHAGWDPYFSTVEGSNSIRPTVPTDLFWNRDFWLSADSMSSLPPYDKVFIGHTGHPNNPTKRKNIINCDANGGWDGYIAVVDVDTEESWVSDSTPMLYSNYGIR